MSKILLGVITTLLIAGAGWFYYTHQSMDSTTKGLLAKRLDSPNHDEILINFAPLRKSVQDYLAKIPTKSSFYFEYLFTGTSIRVGENEELVGASLMKIPLVMSLYKSSEQHLVDMDQEVEVSAPEISPEFGDLWKKGAGTKITLKEAARLTLTNSDNTAANVILDHIKTLKSTVNLDPLKELDVETTINSERRALISARSYASILKCLYLACFLSRDHSQEILDQLTRSTLDNGLVTPLPPGTKAAHKIGTFSQVNESDCGIIYIPKRTYLLCIMLELQENQAKENITALSRMVYQYVSNSQDLP